MRERLIDLVEARERARTISWPAMVSLAPLTLFAHTVLESSRLLLRHEETALDGFDTAWLREGASPEQSATPPPEPDAATLLALRLYGQASGFGAELQTARIGALVAIGLALLISLAPWLAGAPAVASVVTGAYVIAFATLTYLFAFHLRLRQHERAVIYLSLLAEAPGPGETEAALAELDRRWQQTFALDAIFAATALLPCLFGVPLLLLPVVLLAPLGRHLRLATCGPAAGDRAG